MNIKKSIPQVLSRKFGTKFFLLLSIAFTFSSCDESSVVGLDVQPGNDLLNVGWKDTTTVMTRTVKGDSLITDETLISTGEVLIGKYLDPIFGTSTGSLYTQVRLPSNIISTTFGTAPVCDSIILSLVYHGTVYGKKDRKQQKLQVFQVTEPMSTAPVYFSNKTFTKSSTDLTEAIGGYPFIPAPLDSVHAMNDTLKPQMWVQLDKTFGQLLLNNQGTGNLATNTAFQSFFNGIYITTENTGGLAAGEGNIVHFNTGESKIILFYHNSTTTGLKYEFSLGSVARVNHFEHDYSSSPADVQNQIGTTPLSQNDTNYVGGMSGLRTKVTFPYLKNWIDSGSIAVNKAELVIKVNTNIPYCMSDTFSMPNNLMIFGINDDGASYAIPDAFEGSNYFGGSYNSSTMEYKFNIARYVQQILNGERNNNGLYIIVSNGAIFANRVVIGGGKPGGSKQMKLNITYTKLH